MRLAGVNTYTGTTIVDRGALVLQKTTALYNADVSKWTKSNLAAYNGGDVIVSVGGAGQFSVTQAKTLLSNLTTEINNNGLTAYSSFGIDTQNAKGPITFDQVFADSTGDGAGSLGFQIWGDQKLILNQANTYSGGTSIIGGHVQLGHANAIPSGDGKGGLQMQSWINGDAVLDVNGFDVSINALVDGSGAKVVNNAVGTNKMHTLGSDSPDYNCFWFAGEIADNSGTGGTLSLEKVGSNEQILAGYNSYTGPTTVTAGTLLVNGSIASSILTTVKSGATLGGYGYGQVGALTVEEGGTLTPGLGSGYLYTGDYNQAGTLSLEGFSSYLGAEYVQVAVAGSVTLSGWLTFTVPGFVPETGDLLFVIDNDDTDEVNGTFSGMAQGSEFTWEGWLWSISYNADSLDNTFSGGNDVALKSMGAVPEPSAGMLGSLGALGLLRRRRRA